MNLGIKKIKSLCGLKVVGITLEIGDAGIEFSGGATLNIYNQFNLFGISFEEEKKIIGKKFESIFEEQKTIVLNFESGISLHVCMADECYTGPEAIVLQIPGETIIVW
ncbi:MULTISPECIES: hypothetical protein [Leptospira]|uniref:hypothetical protein n=1 Tax=Leptospira TaxID=171 RepID=UPI0002BA5707|nr:MULTISPECIES: hypothetical protein [Leptospira]MCL8312908.1 hypothetical protein [Leptospira interrogans]QOI36682.1 hypothetical protein LeptoLang_21000 [Leptospira interrogans serovar Icterohaemorrhagiae]ULG75633.1 hypothetical protein FH597_01570 [Leptospira interrogans]UML74612.1 hypothetical protein FH583_01680 [Leptospira interrogans]UML74662.1 hypothetical protein FH583_01620 [Leptospira interrogans]